MQKPVSYTHLDVYKRQALRYRQRITNLILEQDLNINTGVKNGTAEKGDVLSVAATAGIMGAKRTSDLIPMCHILPITNCRIDFDMDEEELAICCSCTVKVTGRTGVEMEALTGVSVALLTVYDMCKAMDKTMEIGEIFLVKKTGGKSGNICNGPHSGRDRDRKSGESARRELDIL